MKRIITFFKRLIQSIMKHNIGQLAAVIGFFAFSAMIPFVLLVIDGASLFIQHSLLKHFLSQILKSYIPAIPEAKKYLIHNVTRLVFSGPKITLFSILGFLWSTVGGFVNLQIIMNMIWETRKHRSFFKQYLVGFAMLGVLLLLTVSSSVIADVAPLLLPRTQAFPSLFFWLKSVHGFTLVAFPLLLLFTCYFCYRYLPPYTIKKRYLFSGALVSTLGIYLTRFLFVFYTAHLGQYKLIYGSLTFVMLFTFWLYIVSMIFLFGAEVAFVLHRQWSPAHSNSED